ncbi:uncharacterized protein [Amphiura filiformis]|uniref:uncharacterized protein n=1 Tax=Amphiura filiformis TaxID=82378 RepID=UPI003B20C606
MAAAADAILTIQGLYYIGKDVYERCEAIKDGFGDSKTQLTETVNTIIDNLNLYAEFEKEGKIRFQEGRSSNLTPVGKLAQKLKKQLEKSQEYLVEFEEKWNLRKFFGKNNIEETFKNLAEALSKADDAVFKRVQLELSSGVKPKHIPSPVAVTKSSDIRKIRELVGSGGFGKVYLARHKDKGQVVVKEYFDRRFAREVKNMVEHIHCQYLVNIMGYIDEPKNVSIIMEFCKNGNLKEFNTKFMMVRGVMARKIRMIMDIARGMKYLHTRPVPIYHSGLKLENVFVGGDFTAKIGVTQIGARRGNDSHVPPEARSSEGKIDVPWVIYTFAITLFELLSGQDPWPGMMDMPVYIRREVEGGKRPDKKVIPQYVQKEIIRVMEKCWDQKPKSRPQFSEILQQVSAIYRAYESQLREVDRELNTRALPDMLHSDMRLKPRGGTEINIGKWRKDMVIGEGYLGNPGVVGVNQSNGDMVIGDYGSKCVSVFSAQGKYRFKLSGAKHPLNTPCGVVYTAGRFYVTDRTEYVKSYDAGDGRFCSGWLSVKPGRKVGNARTELEGICVDTEGNVLVGCCLYGAECYISRHTADGKHINSFSVGIAPDHLAVTSYDKIIISGGCALQIVNLTGSIEHKIPRFPHPGRGERCGVCFDSDVIYVCDRVRANIFCLTQDGKYIGTIPIADAQQGDTYRGSLRLSVKGARMVIPRGSGSTARVEVYARIK